MKTKLSSSPKKGSLGFLALFAFLILAILAFYFWPTEEITTIPTQQIIEQKLAEIPAAVEPLKPATVAVSLSEPKPKIDPKLVEELKQLKKEKKHKRVQVLVEIQDDTALAAIKKAGGVVTQNFDTGNIAVVEVQSDKVEDIVSAVGVEQVASEREYNALLADRILAFSVDTAWENNFTGKGVKIAVLDTGVGPNDAVIVTDGKSFVSGEDTADLNGHGTHVAGIAQGVAKDSLIYNAKVLSKTGAGTTSQIIAGIDWAVSNDVDIISMSFGGTFTDLDGPLASAVKDAIDNGVVFVVASGNCKKGCGGFFGVTTPGNVKEVITVGAVDDSNFVASFSSGDTFDGYLKPDVVGPGVDITSAWLDNSEATKSGTSMSTPFVAGIAALLLEKEPGLTNDEVKAKLEESATDKGDTGKDVSYGSGVVDVTGLLFGKVETNASEAVEEVEEGDVTEEKNVTKPKPAFENLTIFTNMTVVFEKEGAGKYTYHTDDGKNLTFEYRIYSPDNDTLDSQMLIAPEVGPGDFVPATLEFAVDDKPSETPLYYYFEVRDVDGAHAITPAAYSLPSSFIDDLYSGDPGDIALIYHSFDAPSEVGTYTAYAYVLSSGFDIVMEDIDTAGHEFDVVEDPIDFGLCDSDSECPDDYYIGSKFCKGGDVYREYRDWECKYPGSSGSYCIFDDYDEEIDSCSSKEECYSGKCEKCDGDGDCESGEKYDWCSEDCDPVCTNDDGDAYGLGWPCALFPDCDDSNPFIYPGAPETCNGKDDDCNGLKDEGFSGIPEDCDNSIDDNCNGVINEGCCGNGACNAVETPGSCSTDCYGDLKVLSITSPAEVEQGVPVTIKATIKNEGTYSDTLYVESGIAPDSWSGIVFSQGYDAQIAYDAEKCCTSNEYYAAKTITLGTGESQEVTFSLTSPSIHSIDGCDASKKTAWDISHTVVVGLYPACGSDYKHKSTKDIKVREKYCSKPTDCDLTKEECIFKGTTGTCQKKVCTNACSANYCNGNKYYTCTDTNGDGCKDKTLNDNCDSTEYCSSTGCVDKSVDTVLTIEESKTKVYKQPGDKLVVNLLYKDTEPVSIDYDTAAFTLDTSTCSSTMTITSNKECAFTVNDKTGTKTIKLAGGNSGTVEIIKDPKGIVVTNKKKLSQHYGDVKSLLQTAYNYAETNRLVLYDLDKELVTTHPWSVFSDYKELPYSPFMLNNDYSLETAQLIREKCIQPACQNTIVLGDDFVVPAYRRETQFLYNYFFFEDEEVKPIYSEIPYVQRTDKPFSEFDDLFYYKGDYSGKKFIIIRPSDLGEMEEEYDELKALLVTKFSPDLEEMDASSVYCNDGTFFSTFNGATLFVFGTEENNQAYNCMPFVAGLENRDAAFIEVNPWDGNNYAVVLNTEDDNVVRTFSAFIDSQAYKKTIGKQWYFLEVGVDTASFVSLACAPFGIPCDTVTDVLDSGIQCGIKQDAVMCGISGGMLAIPYVPSGPVKLAIKSFRAYVGPAAGKFIVKYGVAGAGFFAKNLNKLDEFSLYFKKAADHFGSQWDTIVKVLGRTPEDEHAITEGVRILEKKFGKKLDDFEPALIAGKNPYRAKKLLTAGRLSKDFFEKGWEYSKIGALLRGLSGGEAVRKKVFENGFRAENRLKRSTEDLILSITDNADGAFIDATTNVETVKKFATTNNDADGWIFKIRNRGGQVIDTADTPSIELAAQTNSRLNDHIYGNTATGTKSEFIHAFVDDVDPEDIEGAWRVTKDGNLKEWVPNPNFAGTPSETAGLLELP